MNAENKPVPQPHPPQPDATQRVTHAHELLKGLRERLGSHPELDEAIETLEVALSNLTLNTGGML